MKKLRPVAGYQGSDSYPSLEEITHNRRGFLKKFIASAAATGGVLLGAVPARAQSELRTPGEAPMPRLARPKPTRPGPTRSPKRPSGVDSRPRRPAIRQVEIGWIGHTVICGVRFDRLLVETPDPPVAAAVGQSCHRAGIRRAVRTLARRFRNCAYLRDSNRTQILEAELGRSLTAYFRALASGPVAPLRVTFVRLPPPAPRYPRHPPRLGGVPARPRHLPRGGCASCATDPDGAGAGLGDELGLVGGVMGVLGWLWKRRESDGEPGD